jgi:hypothetical protein
LASGHFAIGHFAEAWRILQQSPFLLQHKFGWNIPMRILEIMLLIELRQLDAVDFPLESLRKQLRKAEIPSPKIQRYESILHLLKALQKTGFSFAKLPRNCQTELASLSPKASPIGWEILQGEVIPFQDWFSEKWAASKGKLKSG